MLTVITIQTIGAGLTLYMMAILLRWTAPWLELDLHRAWWRIIPRVTDPLIQFMRKRLPPMGPMDWSPIAALVAVYIIRLLVVRY